MCIVCRVVSTAKATDVRLTWPVPLLFAMIVVPAVMGVIGLILVIGSIHYGSPVGVIFALLFLSALGFSAWVNLRSAMWTAGEWLFIRNGLRTERFERSAIASFSLMAIPAMGIEGRAIAVVLWSGRSIQVRAGGGTRMAEPRLEHFRDQFDAWLHTS